MRREQAEEGARKGSAAWAKQGILCYIIWVVVKIVVPFWAP